MNMCFYGAIARIPLGIAVAIEFIGPLGVAVVTSRRIREFVWIGLAVAGLVLLTPSIGTDLDPVGVALALAAGVGWASFVLISPRVGHAVGGAGLALAMLVAGLFVLPFELAAGGLGGSTRACWPAALAVAILSTAFPLSLEFEALRRMICPCLWRHRDAGAGRRRPGRRDRPRPGPPRERPPGHRLRHGCRDRRDPERPARRRKRSGQIAAQARALPDRSGRGR